MYNHFTVMLRHDFLLKSEIRLHNSENRLDYVTSNALIDTLYQFVIFKPLSYCFQRNNRI